MTFRVTHSKSRDPVESEDDDLRGSIIDIGPNDSGSPLLWSMNKRVIHTIAFGITTFSAQFNASILAPAIPQIAQEFHVGDEVGTLVMSIYILGNGLGPMLFAPVSEVHGRKIGVFVPYMISAILQMLIACVNSVAAATVLRFFAGIFAAAPIVTSGAAMADLWPPQHRAAALVLYAVFIIMGSSFSPIFGQLLVDTGPYGWRWCCWLGGILGFVVAMVNFCTLSETYRPVLAARRARDLRLSTGKWATHAPHEEWSLSWREFLRVHCARPVLMMCTPIVFLMACFASFAYGLMFLVITSVGDNFEKVKGFTGVAKFLPLIANFVGFCCGGIVNVFNSNYYAKLMAKDRANPETRLYAMMALGWTLPAGCFIYGWTLDERIHWIVPCIGIFFLGMGIAVIFQGALNYIVDCYTRYGASAIAANTLLRSIFGGVFPLFATQLYSRLGVHWGSSLMGFLGLALVPISFVFYIYGARARSINPYEHLIS